MECPGISPPGDQTSAVGERVELFLLARANTGAPRDAFFVITNFVKGAVFLIYTYLFMFYSFV